MWLLTLCGFYSVVQESEELSDTLLVRGRVYQDLETLRNEYLPDAGEIGASSGSDYPFFLRVKKQVFAQALHKIIDDITYQSFKDAVTDSQGYQRAEIYAGVWMELYRLQRGEWQ